MPCWKKPLSFNIFLKARRISTEVRIFIEITGFELLLKEVGVLVVCAGGLLGLLGFSSGIMLECRTQEFVEQLLLARLLMRVAVFDMTEEMYGLCRIS